VSTRAVSGTGPRRRICASFRKSFGKKRPHALRKRETRIAAGRASHLVASCRASCGVGRAAQASSRLAHSAAGRWRGALARSSREIARIAANAGLTGSRKRCWGACVRNSRTLPSSRPRRGFSEEWARLSKERARESAAAERKLQDARREAARLVDAVAKGAMTGRMVSAKLAEFEAEIDRQEACLARVTEANVVALHPATIAVYLDAVEQFAKALSASDAKAACLKLRELIDCIVVAPRVSPGDPIHFEVRGRLARSLRA